MKKIIFVIVFCLIAQLSFAKTYVLLDKLTGEVKGTASISDDHIADWAKNFIIREGGEEYRGKKHYEIKFEDGKVRHATQQEIADYLTEKELEKQQTQEAIEIEKLLKLLDNESVKTKIKDINK